MLMFFIILLVVLLAGLLIIILQGSSSKEEPKEIEVDNTTEPAKEMLTEVNDCIKQLANLEQGKIAVDILHLGTDLYSVYSLKYDFYYAENYKQHIDDYKSSLNKAVSNIPSRFDGRYMWRDARYDGKKFVPQLGNINLEELSVWRDEVLQDMKKILENHKSLLQTPIFQGVDIVHNGIANDCSLINTDKPLRFILDKEAEYSYMLYKEMNIIHLTRGDWDKHNIGGSK